MHARKMLFAPLLLIALFASTAHGADMTAEQLVAKHLEAIGTPEARNAIKTRDLRGTTALTIVVGGSGTITGKAALESEGNKVQFQADFNSVQFKGEQFIYDGNKAYVAMFRPGVRSPLGVFMQAESDIMKEGLFGGVLTTGWSLLNLSAHQPKVSYDGLKSINGKSLHQLTYKIRKGGGDLTIRLYFDPETFRHVYSVYSLTRGAGLSLGGETASASEQEARYKLEESFSDFVSFNGVTLPTTWKMTYSAEKQTAVVNEYLVKATRIENDAKLAPDAFKPSAEITVK
jgi:hypothetical protein